MTLWSCRPAKSREKLKKVYLHYQNVFGHQTEKDSDLPSLASTHKVTSRGLAKTRDKLRFLYLHYYQIGQDGNLPCEASIK